jgi:hypothetical protein
MKSNFALILVALGALALPLQSFAQTATAHSVLSCSDGKASSASADSKSTLITAADKKK